jgi:hypothetical protein
MQAADRAIVHTSSYRVIGQLDDGLTVSLTITPDGSRGTITTHGVSWQEINVGHKVWFRGSRLWQTTVSRTKARRFADKWVLVTNPTAGFGQPGPLSDLPVALPENFFSPRGAMKNDGERTVDGRSVIHIVNGGDAHDILASGTPYPIDWLELDEPGPDGQPCGITISDFNAPVMVTAPKTTLVDS